MELIAWHFVWDSRFLFGLSHNRLLRICCWLPSVIIGLVTLYNVWLSAVDKYEIEVKHFYDNGEKEGDISSCAIVRSEDSGFEVKAAMQHLNRESFSLVLRIIGVTVLCLCLLLQTVTGELWSLGEESALREYNYWRRQAVVWSLPAYCLLLLAVVNFHSSFKFDESVSHFDAVVNPYQADAAPRCIPVGLEALKRYNLWVV